MNAKEMLVYMCAASSSGLFLWGAYMSYQEVTRRTELNPERRVWIQSLLFKFLIPCAQPFAALFGLLAARQERRQVETNEKSFFLSMRQRLRRSLITAGSPDGVTPDEFFGIIVVSFGVCVVTGGIMFALLSYQDVPSLAVLAWVMMGMLGIFLPLFWLRDKLKVRRLTITRALPYSLDLLTLCVEAGMDFTMAIARIIRKLGDQPLSYEFAELLRQIRVGRTRGEALRDLAERVDVTELTSVVSSLIQADELGASLGPVLRIQSDQLRVRRSQRAEKLASEAPVKMLFPLVVFIFPTIFIMIGGTIFLNYLQHQ